MMGGMPGMQMGGMNPMMGGMPGMGSGQRPKIPVFVSAVNLDTLSPADSARVTELTTQGPFGTHITKAIVLPMVVPGVTPIVIAKRYICIPLDD